MRSIILLWLFVLSLVPALRANVIEYRFSTTIEHASGQDIGLDEASLLFSIRIDQEAAPYQFCAPKPCSQFGRYRTLPGTAKYTITGSNHLDGTYVDEADYRLEIIHYSFITSDEFILDSPTGLPIPGLEADRLQFKLSYFLPLPFRSNIVPTEMTAGEIDIYNTRFETDESIAPPFGWHYWLYPIHNIELFILPEPADFNQDHQNDLNDYALFAEYLCHWSCDDDGVCNCAPPAAFDPLADFDEDGDVDLRDVAGFQRSFTGIPIVGDFDNNRTVNLFDFGHFHESNCNWPCAYQFGGEPPCNDPALWESACDPPAVPHPRADIDKDGDSDFYDFAQFQNAFGSGE